MLNYYKQIIIFSISALLANKARSFLTMLGIIIGIGAVIIIMSIGAGAQNLILSQIESLGTNIIGIMPGKSDDAGPPTNLMGIVITTLSYEDALALQDEKNVPNIIGVVAFSNGVGTVSWNTRNYDTNLKGTTIGYLNVNGGELEVGRFFNNYEEKNLSRVAIIGSTVKQELFGESDAIGKKIKIKKRSFEVIGVMKERGSVAFQDYDDQILLPIKTMQKLISGVNHLGLIRVKIDNEKNLEQAIIDIGKTLREEHNITDMSGINDDFTIRSASDVLNMIKVITNSLRYFLATMAAMSLIVGGIGIMNIMLASVTKRTHEIGLRKSIGANNFNIMSQFLIETIIITLIGGILGTISGIFISYLIAIGAQFLGYNWIFIVSSFSIFLAVSISTLIGFIFGLYPAIKASKLEPIEALRYE